MRKTISVSLDVDFIKELDKMQKKLGTTRSGALEVILREYLSSSNSNAPTAMDKSIKQDIDDLNKEIDKVKETIKKLLSTENKQQSSISSVLVDTPVTYEATPTVLDVAPEEIQESEGSIQSEVIPNNMMSNLLNIPDKKE